MSRRSTITLTLSTFLAVVVGLIFAAPAEAAVPPPPVTGAYLGLWTLNQTAGPAVPDASGNGHTGTVDPRANQVSFYYDSTRRRNVGYFANNSGRINIPASATLSPGSRDFALGVTVKTTDSQANLIQAGTTRQTNPFIKIELHDGVTCRIQGAQGTKGYKVFSPMRVWDNVWHVIRCDKTADWIVLRVDGNIIAQRHVAVAGVNVSNRMWSIGGKYLKTGVTAPDDMLTGSLSDAFILAR